MGQKLMAVDGKKQHIFKDATIRRLIRGRLTHKQAVSSETVQAMNALLTVVFNEVCLALDDYERFPFTSLKVSHFDAAAKKWLLAKRWQQEKQALMGALRSIEGSAAVWRSSEGEED
jgi:hypothetical protein